MKPELGDKMSSRHGQKGVCGMIYAQEDMPFNKDGISPDIIINPHAIPSRMTIGQLIECVLCKLGCKHAMTFDGTAFNNQSTNKLFNVLDSGKKNTDELHKYCDEILYNGFTGEQIPCHIFFGPTYYYRLKHMVSDKVNYRTTGPMTATTKQPTKGRANGGGLRIGEMETNAILGHGLGSFLKESMMERSDSYSYFIENEHGTVAMGDKDNLKSTYKNENTHDYSNVKTPYSLKLLLQEIEAFSIKPSIITDETHEFDEVYENPSIIN
jgi:DNA-directed RNA polymerase II subunit RPB2